MAYVADRLAITITDHAQRERVRSLMAALDGIASGLADTTMQVEAGARTVLAVAETVDERPHSTTTMALMTDRLRAPFGLDLVHRQGDVEDQRQGPRPA